MILERGSVVHFLDATMNLAPIGILCIFGIQYIDGKCFDTSSTSIPYVLLKLNTSSLISLDVRSDLDFVLLPVIFISFKGQRDFFFKMSTLFHVHQKISSDNVIL